MKRLCLILGCAVFLIEARANTNAILWKLSVGQTAYPELALDEAGHVWVAGSSRDSFPEDSIVYRVDPSGKAARVDMRRTRAHSSFTVAENGAVWFPSFDHGIAMHQNGMTRFLKLRTKEKAGISLGGDGSLYTVLTENPLSATQRGSFMCALTRDGVAKWAISVRGWSAAKPVVGARGAIYFSSHGLFEKSDPKFPMDGLVAVSPDGAVLWKLPEATGHPVIGSEGVVYVAGADETLFAVEPGGQIKWRASVVGGVANAPVISADGNILVGTSDGYAAAVSKDGVVLWYFETEGVVSYCGTTSKEEDAAYLARRLRLNRPEHPVLWHSFAVLASGDILVPFGGTLAALSAEGKLRWKVECSASVMTSPLVDKHGQIFLVTNDEKHSHVVSISGNSSLADSPWPCYGHDPRRTGNAAMTTYR